MLLKGEEAKRMYLAQISQNLIVLAQEVAVLQRTCAERTDQLALIAEYYREIEQTEK
jgi:hypothetical protein